jgi:hypothetical protein
VAVQSYKDAFVSVDGTDLSAFIRTTTLTYSAEALDKTAVSDNTRSRIGGLKDWTVDLDFYQDFDASSVDAVLFDLIGSSTIALIVSPTTNAASSTNPQYTGTAYCESYTPVAGSVGEIMMSPVRFLAASDLSRVTT